MAPRLSPGDRAPAFSLLDQDDAPVSLRDCRRRRVVVYFYPAALTPACAAEACDFRDSLHSLAGAGIALLGISPDEPAVLRRFAERDALNFPLLSDPDHAVHDRYGAWGQKVLYGRTVTGVIRSTFVVGPGGRIEHALYNVRATGHVGRLRRLLGV